MFANLLTGDPNEKILQFHTMNTTRVVEMGTLFERFADTDGK